MPHKRAKAEAIVAACTEGRALSADDRERIVGALAEDLRAASTQATNLEERLAKVETQTQRLQEAVLAIYCNGTVGGVVAPTKDKP